MRAGHIPAAPPLLERRAVIDDGAAQLRARPPGDVGEHAADQDTGHAKAVRGEMTREAPVGALEPRGITQAGVLLQGLKDDALPRIVRRHLQERRARDVPDDDAIVEVQGARVRRVCERMLDAGFREQQDLRFDRYVELCQHGAEKPRSAVELEGGGTGAEVALQHRYVIAQCRAAIVDCRMLIEGTGEHRARLPAHQDERAGPQKRHGGDDTHRPLV
jgi:hypothetical protein